jgi:tRNA(fMet)-specific endonuclease VapC
MKYVLDTDHISLIHRKGPEGRRIEERLEQVLADGLFVSIISYEEQTRGWFAELSRRRSFAQQEAVYSELARMLELYCATPILHFDRSSVSEFHRLWLMKLHLGTMDLKIAAITLANDAILLTRN